MDNSSVFALLYVIIALCAVAAIALIYELTRDRHE